jgi:predicted RNase H-like HicB family nuclease
VHKYAIIVEKARGNYSAYCPDLPGCMATGQTVGETIDRMKEAIEFHLEGLKKERLSVPEPSTTIASIEVAV